MGNHRGEMSSKSHMQSRVNVCWQDCDVVTEMISFKDERREKRGQCCRFGSGLRATVTNL